MGLLLGKRIIKTLIQRWRGLAREGMKTETPAIAPSGEPTPQPSVTAMATATGAEAPSQQARPLAAPVPAYEELAPGIYRHILSDETVLAADVLTFAESHPESELHTCFEWDDSRAGTFWRLEQVKDLLLRSLVIRPDGAEEMRPTARTG
jgi:hypothetical protein